MGSLLFTIASFIVALGILITVHEFGHFWVARKLGVKVLRFSVGFGKPLLTFKGRSESKSADSKPSDGTEYVVAAIPLGGYVKMLDEREGEVAEHEVHRAFNRQPLPVRTAIVFAGPLFNFLFAILAFWMVFVLGDTGSKPWIGTVESNSIADKAGFRAGDLFTKVEGESTLTWETTIYSMLQAAADDRSIRIEVVEEGGQIRQLSLPGQSLINLAEEGKLLDRIGIEPKRPDILPVLGTIVKGEAADLAGLKSGDRILSVGGVQVALWGDLVKQIRKHPMERTQFQISRDGQIKNIDVIVGSTEAGEERIGRIGAGPHIPEGIFDDYRVEVRYGAFESVGKAVAKTWETSGFMLKMLGKMVTGNISVKNLSGPISIAQTAGQTASYGGIQFLKFLALISVSLGVLNLLPIPVLDGGHLFFYLIEWIKGSPLSDEMQLQGQKIGLVLLLCLMGLAFYVDISRLLG